MRIAIVEDEAMVARRLARMVREIVGGEPVITVAETLGAARELIDRGAVDLLFLDLNLGGSDGFDLLSETAAESWQTVVVSAHHDQAARAFDYGVTDFVIKPFSEVRLRKALGRALGKEAPRASTTRCLTVRKGREIRPLPVERIVFIRGADDFSELQLDDGTSHLHQKTLSALERILPPVFLRVHRSYIVNVGRARGMRGSTLILDQGVTVPVGRVYRASLREKLGIATG